MKIDKITKQYGFDPYEFETFCRNEKTIQIKFGYWGNEIPDPDVTRAVELFKNQKAMEAEKEERARVKEQEHNEALASILITSGFNFDGYTITKYSGYISGDDATKIPRTGLLDEEMNGQKLTNALAKIRRQALKELKEAAFDLGCNAVIGVDFDYITLEPETANIAGGTHYEPYIICVTANGNAVVIEKN